MFLIGISGKRGSGKTTLANICKERFGWIPLHLATPLKEMVKRQFDLIQDQVDGCLKEQPTQYVDYARKHYPVYLTPRDILIRTGQFYRSIDPLYWIKALKKQILQTPHAQAGIYVIPDVRFENEATFIKQHGGLMVRLDREEARTGKYIDDPSETELDNYVGFDLRVPCHENEVIDDLHVTAELLKGLVSARMGNA